MLQPEASMSNKSTYYSCGGRVRLKPLPERGLARAVRSNDDRYSSRIGRQLASSACRLRYVPASQCLLHAHASILGHASV
jgi:hypothetical protein